MQTDCGNNSVTAAMVAALVTRRPATNEAPSHNLMKTYLDKLKELVPHCPKNRNVSKLELIQHVIDYINDLQETLQRGSDSPPDSPAAADPVSFTEAFSNLNFNESGDMRGMKAFLHVDSSAGYNSNGAVVYTSDGSSDYDSRGSSPINHHSDAEYSSDEFSPFVPQPYHATGSTFSTVPNAAVASARPLTHSSNDYHRRLYRKGFGLSAHYHHHHHAE